MSNHYRIDRLHIITYKNQKKKALKDLRCRYLAKSQFVKCNAQGKKFYYVNFRGSHFNKVSFDNANFFGCDFWGTSFNNCSFKKAKISDCVLMACRFKNCDFTGAIFSYSYIVNTGLHECRNIDLKGIKIYKQYPKSQATAELVEVLDLLRNDLNIRKNKLLHLPGNRYNELNLFLLQERFSLEELPKLLLELNSRSTTNITTYKKLELSLKKIKSNMV